MAVRSHPARYVRCIFVAESQALKDQKTQVLEVTVADSRQVLVEADSASTSSEVCSTIATMLQIKDSFGFALLININGKVGDNKSRS
jgi:hypothetical protein